MMVVCYVDLSLQGVYRVSGQNSEIIDLKEKFNQGKPSQIWYLGDSMNEVKYFWWRLQKKL